MIKKFLLSILLLYTSFIGYSVYASTSINYSVCSSECDFTTLDQALSAAEDATSTAFIRVYSEETQVLTDHTLSHMVHIDFDQNGTIDGNGSLIKSENVFSAMSNDMLKINNVNFLYTRDINDEREGFEGANFVVIGGMKAHLTNINISSLNAVSCNTRLVGLNASMRSYSIIENVNVSNFSIGVFANKSTITINNCDLHNNSISVHALKKAVISNCKLYNLFVEMDLELKDNNDFGNAKVRFITSDEFVHFNNDICAFSDEPALNIDRSDESTMYPISIEKDLEIDLNKQKNINDMLSIFKDKKDDNEDFTYNSSNPNVVSVSNNKIQFRKVGTATVSAVSEPTGEEYTLNFRIVQPVSNPSTGYSFIALIVGICLVIVASTYSFVLKKKQ